MRFWTALWNRDGHTCHVKLGSIKTMLAAGWILAIGVAAMVGNPHATSSWVVLVAVALAPPIAMLWWWNDPPETMSESINQARR